MLQSANAKSVQIKFYTADRLPCFDYQMFKKWPLKLGRMYQTAHQNDGFNALRLNCINSTLPACGMIPCQTSKLLQSCKSFEKIFCFHRTLGISPQKIKPVSQGMFHVKTLWIVQGKRKTKTGTGFKATRTEIVASKNLGTKGIFATGLSQITE